MAKKSQVIVSRITDMPLMDKTLRMELQQRLNNDVLMRYFTPNNEIVWSQFFTCDSKLPDEEGLEISVRVHPDATVTLVYLRKRVRISTVAEHVLTPRY